MKTLCHLAVMLLAASALAAEPPVAPPGRPTAAASVAVPNGFRAVLNNGFVLHHVRSEKLGEATRLYTETGYVDVATAAIVAIEIDDTPRPAPETAPAANPLSVPELVHQASGKHFIDSALISSMIGAESGGNEKAVSPKGARGLMQLMPGTAARLGVQNPFDPAANIDGGTRFIRELLLRYNDNLAKALAAYNAGPQRVEQYKGVPPYRETQAYVRRIINEFNRRKLAEKNAQRSAAGTQKIKSSQPPSAGTRATRQQLATVKPNGTAAKSATGN